MLYFSTISTLVGASMRVSDICDSSCELWNAMCIVNTYPNTMDNILLYFHLIRARRKTVQYCKRFYSLCAFSVLFGWHCLLKHIRIYVHIDRVYFSARFYFCVPVRSHTFFSTITYFLFFFFRIKLLQRNSRNQKAYIKQIIE